MISPFRPGAPIRRPIATEERPPIPDPDPLDDVGDCPECDGRGRIWFHTLDDLVPCGECGGTGEAKWQ